MRRSRGVCTALALFGLLAFATSAGADCAWVLWHSYMSATAQTSDLIHFPAKAYESKAECDAAINQRIDRELAWDRANPGKPFPARRDVVGGMFYACWPDTIDPRGPKGR
jgi:hypothetical protein